MDRSLRGTGRGSEGGFLWFLFYFVMGGRRVWDVYGDYLCFWLIFGSLCDAVFFDVSSMFGLYVVGICGGY